MRCAHSHRNIKKNGSTSYKTSFIILSILVTSKTKIGWPSGEKCFWINRNTTPWKKKRSSTGDNKLNSLFLVKFSTPVYLSVYLSGWVSYLFCFSSCSFSFSLSLFVALFIYLSLCIPLSWSVCLSVPVSFFYTCFNTSRNP